jgi:FkbM family methyltransferase
MDLRAVNPEIDDQGAELGLIAALIPELDDRSAIDVGSEHGAVAGGLRDAGADPIWLVEPFPGNVARLREKFGTDPGVHVLEVAAGMRDGTAELHLAHDASGGSLDAFHTLHPGPPGADLAWEGSVPVQVRSLDSLSAAGEIPGRVGLLKIDAEGSDADVLRGAASLTADVVMVEFWRNLPGWVGTCPFGIEELRALVEPLGPRRFVFVRHGPRHLTIERWDTADVADGEWGNLVFVADSLVQAAEAALPTLDRALFDRSERITAEQEDAAAERLKLIEQLTQEAGERLKLLERGGLVKRLRKKLRRAPPTASSGPPADEALDDVEQESRSVGPVEGTVVEPDGQHGDRSRDDLAVADDGPRRDPVDPQDRDLGRVQ